MTFFKAFFSEMFSGLSGGASYEFLVVTANEVGYPANMASMMFLLVTLPAAAPSQSTQPVMPVLAQSLQQLEGKVSSC